MQNCGNRYLLSLHTTHCRLHSALPSSSDPSHPRALVNPSTFQPQIEKVLDWLNRDVACSGLGAFGSLLHAGGDRHLVIINTGSSPTLSLMKLIK